MLLLLNYVEERNKTALLLDNLRGYLKEIKGEKMKTELINNKSKAIGEIGQEIEKGFVFFGVIADILEKYEIRIKADIKEIWDLYTFIGRLREEKGVRNMKSLMLRLR